MEYFSKLSKTFSSLSEQELMGNIAPIIANAKIILIKRFIL